MLCSTGARLGTDDVITATVNIRGPKVKIGVEESGEALRFLRAPGEEALVTLDSENSSAQS